MLLRTVVGACAGALAGTGFALTIDWLRRYCYISAGRTGCGRSSLMLLPLLFVFWTLVAGVLIHVGFRLGDVERGWWVTGLGGGLWTFGYMTVAWLHDVYVDTWQDDRHNFLMAAAVVVACVAHGVAALCVGRRRAW